MLPCARSALSLCLVLASGGPAGAWGDRGHRLVNAAAVENLPEPLRSYFRARQAYLLEHASDPDHRAHEDLRERPHHYTEVDGYDSFPFPSFKAQFVAQQRGPTVAQLRYGDSVWQIERFALCLARDFRRHHWDDVDRDAVFLAHYACDLTQPLHTTVNYDGQLTNQGGIHARFETALVSALADRWVLKPAPVREEADLRALIFEEYLASYAQRNLIFASDRIARTGRTYLDSQFMPAFITLASPVARKRLEAAAFFVSSLWYTAWVRAGKPTWKLETGGWQFETRDESMGSRPTRDVSGF